MIMHGKAPNTISDLKVGQMAFISALNDWNGLTGIVDKVVNQVAYIFCVQRPTYYYEVRHTNLHDVTLVYKPDEIVIGD